MCLIALNWRPEAAIPLLIAANRDEFYARPTLPLHRWDNSPIVAGKDLQAGGTWLGGSLSGRVAALTNYRDPASHRVDAPSRGDITTRFLVGTTSAADYLAELATRSSAFNPFNLLVFDGTKLLGFESRQQKILSLHPGVHAVSNADFNTPWPKLSRLRNGFDRALTGFGIGDNPTLNSTAQNALFSLLNERRTAADASLPQTGLTLARERALSAEFIQTPDYGTRASSLLWFDDRGVQIVERSFDAHGFTGEKREQLPWKVAA